jgi:nuclear pore complex protein Nup133
LNQTIGYAEFIIHSSSPFQSVLKEAVVKYMEEIGESTQEDVMRVFFRSRVADIGKLLSKVSDIVIAISKSSTGNVDALLSEANSVIVVSPCGQNMPIFLLTMGFRRF